MTNSPGPAAPNETNAARSKRSRGAIGIAVATAVIGSAAWIATSPLAKPTAPRAQAVIADDPRSVKALAAQPIEPTALTTSAPDLDDASAACRGLLERLADTPGARLLEDAKRGALEVDPACRSHFGGSEWARKAEEACARNAETGRLSDEVSCAQSLMFARAIAIDRLTAGRVDYRRLGAAVLANKIAAAMAELGSRQSAIPEIGKMAEALVELEPGSLEARKALVTARIAAFSSPDFDSASTRESIEQALALQPQDAQLTESKLVLDVMTGGADGIRTFLAQNPESGIGHYYNAWASSKAGDIARALAELAIAQGLMPGDPRLERTAEALRSGRIKDAFQFTMGFRFDGI